MRLRLTRRDFLRAGGAGLALGALPSFLRFAPGEGRALAAASAGRFFDETEYRTIDAAVARLIPDDVDPFTGAASPGAGPARVVDFIDRMLGAFNVDAGETPFVFAGGPFSDRNPDPDPSLCAGAPPPVGPTRPNDTATPVPLTVRQTIAWKARILGTAALGAEGDFIRSNNQALGEGDANGDTPGLQEIYRSGVAGLNQFSRDNFGADYADLDPLSQELALNFFEDQEFVGLLFQHAVEGMYANPEYGGNQPTAETGGRPAGWSYPNFGGDRQPLGYTIFDEATKTYCELPEHPVSGAEIGPDRAPLEPATVALLPDLVKRLRLGR